jgi:hypothetical protein
LEARTLTCSVAELAVGESWSGTASARATDGSSVSVNVEASSTEQDPVAADNSISVSVAIDSPEPAVSWRNATNGGGCVYDPNSRGDPTLPALLFMALIALWWRRRYGVQAPRRS